ncbi:SpoIIE family protein phosphatase [Pseudoduganella umbonata]|uniref:Protein-serine/threonine phosphatase n=1 Tax=Pseudoduganella umbonata TaxID=864828 RepID=A0A4P8HML5_9BURK|nr:SpoIIE family protein phosphatase [Pseudoduganella umbonata]MBB3219607.1 serine phosphatase RsbU (regulator of sigma subunit) [Pseudoduganella umbonata]QCP09674.1 protein-serine/threonine phosphatase [Pseudoduganella umbonata]
MTTTFNPSRHSLPRFRPATAADLCVATASVPASASNGDVLALFTERRELMTLPVVEEGRPIGLISRNIFMSQMSKPFYQELYGRKSCIAFMDKAPLVVEADLSIEALTFRAVESGEKALADGFIITRAGQLQGVGYGLQLMNVVANMQAERNRQIMHSIEYASVIQRALLRASDEALAAALPDAALVWQPRDVVGGDFYHVAGHAGGWCAVIADCTGHGVPGAFMTLIASSLLTQALQGCGPREPAALLAELNRGVKDMLGQHGKARYGGAAALSNDGLDAAALWFDGATRQLSYAGARLPLFVLVPGEPAFRILEADRTGIGYAETPAAHRWSVQTVHLPPGSLLFACTDGLFDQIGGEREISFGKRRVQQLLLEHRDAGAAALAGLLAEALGRWQGGQPRRDDVTYLCCRP